MVLAPKVNPYTIFRKLKKKHLVVINKTFFKKVMTIFKIRKKKREGQIKNKTMIQQNHFYQIINTQLRASKGFVIS